MGRKARLYIAGQPQLVFLEQLAEKEVFLEEDARRLLELLKKFSQSYEVSIHAYSVTKDQIWLVVTPGCETCLSKFMQTLLRTFVRSYNKVRGLQGPLFAQRYKSAMIETPDFYLKVVTFIEQLSFIESSLSFHLYGEKNTVLIPHDCYLALADTKEQRLLRYAKLIEETMPSSIQRFIAQAIEKQRVIGSIEFVKDLESQEGVRLMARARGRLPKKLTLKERTMYKKLEVLSKDAHKGLRVKPLENLQFASGLAFVPVATTEVKAIACDFPVVFSVDEQGAGLIALTSLGNENLALNAEGKWIKEYVPMHLRKYPFALAVGEGSEEEKIILIDVEADNVSYEEGAPLFTDEAEPTEALEHAIQFLKELDAQSMLTQAIVKEIAEADVLVDREITIDVEGETKVLVRGFKVVDREKLVSLEDGQLADWTKRGVIALIEFHLASLDKVNTLFQLAAKQQ